jgi:hypothetical protein
MEGLGGSHLHTDSGEVKNLRIGKGFRNPRPVNGRGFFMFRKGSHK